MPSRPSSRGAALGERLGRAHRLRRRVAVAQSRDQRLGRPHRRGPAAQHGGERALDGARRAPCRRRAPRARCRSHAHAVGVEQLTREEERSRVRAADARQRERGDRRRYQAQAHLGEAEARVLAREHDVAAAGEPGAAAQRSAVHARDHGHRAAVDGREHGRGALGVGDVALARELARRAHPLEVGAGAEGGARPASTTARSVSSAANDVNASCTAAISSASNALRALGPIEPHPRDAPLALDGEAAHIRKTPKRGSGIGARAAAARPSARTRRVSRGSITPSSHRRAVE